MEFENIEIIHSKFDLIVIDPFHEYEYSKQNFNLFSSLLTEEGLLLCHDCFPMNKRMASPVFISGSWCGETYIAFVEFAHKNPDFFYGVLNIDTGIGFMSKKKLEFLENNLDTHKQQTLLTLHNYFIENSKDLINSIP